MTVETSTPAPRSRSGALRWGIVGAGRIASEWVIPAIRAHEQGQVVAVLSSDEARAAAFARENGIPGHGSDRSRFFANPDIDAVYVCTTNERHAGDTIEAAAAGKHVLCEKPMALDEASAVAMIRACRDARLVLAVNHHMRCMETHRAIRDIVRSGVLGTLTLVRIFFGIGLSDDAKRWRLGEGASGGGAMLDLSVHIADLLRFLFDDDLRHVTCMTDGGDRGIAAEQTTQASIRMKSGLLVSTVESFSTPDARTSLEIHGQDGSLVAQDVLLQTGIGTLRLRCKGERREIPVTPAPPYVRVIREFSAAVRGEGRPAASGEDGLLSLLAVLKARESAHSGRRTEVPALPTFSGLAQ